MVPFNSKAIHELQFMNPFGNLLRLIQLHRNRSFLMHKSRFQDILPLSKKQANPHKGMNLAVI